MKGEIYANNAASYFYAVARNLLKEYWESPERHAAALESLPQTGALSQGPIARIAAIATEATTRMPEKRKDAPTGRYEIKIKEY